MPNSENSLEQELQAIANNVSLFVADEELLNQNFINNLATFQQYYPDVYELIKSYQPKRYFIDIVDNFPNVIDSITQQHLYQYPPYLLALHDVEKFRASPHSVNASFKIDKKHKGNFLHNKYVNQLVALHHERVDQESLSAKPLAKYVNTLKIFGTGCGYQIELFAQHHQVQDLFIVEPDIDLFYCSLFTTNWRFIFESVERNNGNIQLLLGIQEHDYIETLLSIFSQSGLYKIVQSYGFVSYQTLANRKLVSCYIKRFRELIQGWGFFDDAIISVAHLLKNLENQTPLLTRYAKLDKWQKDLPVVVVGNGPSLDNDIEFIKRERENCLLISCGTALSALYKYSIKPDIHCEQERTYPVAEKIDFYCPKEFLEDIILFAPTTVHPEVFSKFKKRVMVNKHGEPSAELIAQNEQLSCSVDAHYFLNPTVANTAMTFIAAFGFENCYLVGVDLGHECSGSHHSKQSLYYDNEQQDLKLHKSGEGDIEVEGNFGGTFLTNPFFSMSAVYIDKLLQNYPQINCFNLSNGIKISHATPMKSADIQFKKQESKDSGWLDMLVQHATFVDCNGEVSKQLSQLLEFDSVERICQSLQTLCQAKVSTRQQAVNLLNAQSAALADKTVVNRDFIYLLLYGSILHVQAMLTRLIFEAQSDSDALADFHQGLALMNDFLEEIPTLYRDMVFKENSIQSLWLEQLKAQKKKSG